FFIGEPALEFIAKPVKEQLAEFQLKKLNAQLDKHHHEMEQEEKNGVDPLNQVEQQVDMWWLADQLGIDRPKEQWGTIKLREDTKGKVIEYTKIQVMDINKPTLKFFTILEAMMIYFKVCIYLGIVLGSPWIFWQLWSFIAAGLYPHEKKLVRIYLPFSIALFL